MQSATERPVNAPVPLFRGRQLVIATMHGKETVVAPRLGQALGVVCRIAGGLNTDRFGTFSGEIPRTVSPLEAARQKIEEAMRLTGLTLAVASEGSFGPHPQIPFVAADTELLLLHDAETGLEVLAEVVSTDTNFASGVANSSSDLADFAEKTLFPAHGLILRNESGILAKGIHDWSVLEALARQVWDQGGTLTVETDMRAMHNPSRMRVIASCAEALTNKLASACPVCHWPGFSITERRPGLPCGQCGLPTRLRQTDVYTCKRCGFRDEKKVSDAAADPMYCDFCNP